MSQSIKLNDNNFIDTTGVYDSTHGQTQNALNTSFDAILTNCTAFNDLGDCRGDNSVLYSWLTTYYNSIISNRIAVCSVSDNVGSSVIEGGILAVVIFKVNGLYAPVLGMHYGNPGSIFLGSFNNGVFSGFTKLH